MIDIGEKLKQLPTDSGVYVMLNDLAQVIYVGKAKNLKNRVRQYFQNSGNKTEKVMRMVEKICDFYYIITKSEADALVLENNLIKKHKPYYNILLKDDKTYPYIKVNVEEAYPSFQVTRKIKKDGAKYFGPYLGGSLRSILDVLSIVFKVRPCKTNFDNEKFKKRACLNYHLGRCVAPCVGNVEKETYLENVKEAIKFLNGDVEKARNVLNEKMAYLSKIEDFEGAIVFRNRINLLDSMKDKHIVSLAKDVNMDVFSFSSNDEYGAMSLLMLRNGKIINMRNFMLDVFAEEEKDIYESFLMQFYSDESYIPNEVVIGGSIEDDGIALSEVLSFSCGHKVNVICPKQGVRGQLVEMAKKNAFDFMEKNADDIKRKQAMTVGAVAKLQDYLHLRTMPRRIECYDISNISGTNKVASMVVFFDGEPLKTHYRRFKIKTVEGANDFECMAEVINRRFSNISSEDLSFKEQPDLIVVDGGKGQLAYALNAMRELNIDCNLISLAKREEEVFLPMKELPVIIPKSSVALKLLQRLRDEAHRFAITYHRLVRNKSMLSAELENINGIGKNRRIALIEKFQSILKIKNATVDELCEVDGISDKLAKKIIDSFNNKE